jgi:prepilin-type N-terminal cleavage/methylation domain-containing protein
MMMDSNARSIVKIRPWLLQLLVKSPLQSSRQKGFTMIEVLVALAISMIFLSIALQMMVSAAFFRSKASQYNEAFNLIQQDYETVFSKATEYENSVSPYSQKCLATSSANGLAASFIGDTTTGLGGSSTSIGPITLSGQSFTMTRTADYASSNDPYRLVGLTYTVTPTAGGTAVVSINTEVVLYAGFKCPG